MRKAILKRFILVLILTVFISGTFFYIIVSRVILNNTKEDMLVTLQMLDESIDYERDLQSQITSLQKLVDNKITRFTILDEEGNVRADSEVEQYDSLENHNNREEIVKAKEKGVGYSTRYSSTLNTNMMYIAMQSDKSDYYLRVAIPFAGSAEYLILLMPAILVSMGIALTISIIFAESLTKSITEPLSDMTEKLGGFKENTEFQFEPYEYEELNVIADTVTKMSESIRKYMDGIEFERMVRQEFFTNASHELKTPITSIRGYAELLQAGFAKDEKTKEEFMNRIIQETENMTTLINDILMISRLETHEAEMIVSEVRISILSADVIKTLKPYADKNKVTFHVECKPLTILANPQQMRELLLNLIGNAVKYNKPEGCVNVEITSENEDLKIIVSDTGVGIPEESINRIFERFYRVDKGRSKKVGGTGLGLSIVKHIINYYNGTIQVKSVLDQGSRFEVHIPDVVDNGMGAAHAVSEGRVEDKREDRLENRLEDKLEDRLEDESQGRLQNRLEDRSIEKIG